MAQLKKQPNKVIYKFKAYKKGLTDVMGNKEKPDVIKINENNIDNYLDKINSCSYKIIECISVDGKSQDGKKVYTIDEVNKIIKEKTSPKLTDSQKKDLKIKELEEKLERLASKIGESEVSEKETEEKK